MGDTRIMQPHCLYWGGARGPGRQRHGLVRTACNKDPCLAAMPCTWLVHVRGGKGVDESRCVGRPIANTRCTRSRGQGDGVHNGRATDPGRVPHLVDPRTWFTHAQRPGHWRFSS